MYCWRRMGLWVFQMRTLVRCHIGCGTGHWIAKLRRLWCSETKKKPDHVKLGTIGEHLCLSCSNHLVYCEDQVKLKVLAGQRALETEGYFHPQKIQTLLVQSSQQGSTTTWKVWSTYAGELQRQRSLGRKGPDSPHSVVIRIVPNSLWQNHKLFRILGSKPKRRPSGHTRPPGDVFLFF